MGSSYLDSLNIQKWGKISHTFGPQITTFSYYSISKYFVNLFSPHTRLSEPHDFLTVTPVSVNPMMRLPMIARRKKVKKSPPVLRLPYSSQLIASQPPSHNGKVLSFNGEDPEPGLPDTPDTSGSKSPKFAAFNLHIQTFSSRNVHKHVSRQDGLE